METKPLIKIVGMFNPSSRIGARLDLRGPFNREAIDEAIKKLRPYTFAPEYEKGKGHATFPVQDGKNALQLVRTLNEELSRYGFVVKWDPNNLPP